MVHLRALKVNISVRTSKMDVEFDPASFLAGIAVALGGALAQITDAPFRFRELVLTQSF